MNDTDTTQAESDQFEAKEPATITSVKIEKQFRLPAIAFCSAQGEQTSEVFFGCSDFGVYRIDSAAEKVEAAAVSEQKHQSYVTGIVRAGESVVSGSYDGSLIWWNPADGQIRHHVENAHARWIRQLVLSPGRKHGCECW